MEYVVALVVTVAVYGLSFTLVISTFELLRRKVAREPDASFGGVFREAFAAYRRGRA